MIQTGIIKLANSPDETFSIVINETLYTFRQMWNTLGFWTLSIFDDAGTALIHNAKLVSGIFILEQYPSIEFDLYIDTELDPQRDNITDIEIGVYV